MRFIRKSLRKKLATLGSAAVLAGLTLLGCGSGSGDNGGNGSEEDCEPGALYGPPPCYSDQNCIDLYGDNWYCDQDNTFFDGCSDTSWPICRDSNDS